MGKRTRDAPRVGLGRWAPGRGRLGLVTVAAALVMALVPALGASPAAAAEDYTFAQSQRMNSLTIRTGTDTFATQNALGGAIVGGAALSQLQLNLDQQVASGAVSLLLEMPGLNDLSGTNEPPFQVGVMQGAPMLPPSNPATYDGTSDLDWWYQPSPSDVDADGNALHELTASFTAGSFAAGPGTIAFANPFAPGSLRMSGAEMEATSGASSVPLESSNGLPPGHVPDENLPDALTSFGSMTGGRLAGNVSAASLAATPIPSALAGSGLTNCAQAYTVTNSMLDVLVGGCTILFTSQITPTQPDTVDPAEGSGTYLFTTNLVTRAVNGCLNNGQPAVLADCLDAAAYSSYFHFTTDRVIVRRECEPGSYSSIGLSPCTPAAPGFYVADAGATSQTACPPGTTSLGSGATSCPAFVTAAEVLCAKNPVPIGVATLCTATVTNEIPGSAPTGAVSWFRPTGSGTYSPAACLLVASGETGACSVNFTPAPGSAGSRQLGASYIGDSTHASSNDQVALQVAKRSTKTTVRCKPKTVVHGKSTVCKARVTDTTEGTAIAPTGKVKWSAPKRFGAFKKARCRLSTRNGVTSCRVTFKTKSSARGRFRVKAAYLGDANHTGSSRRARVTVT